MEGCFLAFEELPIECEVQRIQVVVRLPVDARSLEPSAINLVPEQLVRERGIAVAAPHIVAATRGRPTTTVGSAVATILLDASELIVDPEVVESHNRELVELGCGVEAYAGVAIGRDGTFLRHLVVGGSLLAVHGLDVGRNCTTVPRSVKVWSCGRTLRRAPCLHSAQRQSNQDSVSFCQEEEEATAEEGPPFGFSWIKMRLTCQFSGTRNLGETGSSSNVEIPSCFLGGSYIMMNLLLQRPLCSIFDETEKASP